MAQIQDKEFIKHFAQSLPLSNTEFDETIEALFISLRISVCISIFITLTLTLTQHTDFF